MRPPSWSRVLGDQGRLERGEQGNPMMPQLFLAVMTFGGNRGNR